MSNIGVKGEQSTSTEIALLTALSNLATSGSGQAIQKTSATTVANVSLASVSPSIVYVVVSTSSDYTATQTAGGVKILVDATFGPRQVTLPTAVGNGALFSIKKVGTSANTVTVIPAAGQSIDGGSSVVIKTLQASVDIFTDGSNWFVE